MADLSLYLPVRSVLASKGVRTHLHYTVDYKYLNAQLGIGRGGARNFRLGGPSYDVNILVKTNFYTHMYIN